MSWRVLAALCALFLGANACAGDRFEAVSTDRDGAIDRDGATRDTVPNDASPNGGDADGRDAILADARESGSDAGSYDSTLPRDGGDVSQDRTMSDRTATDSPPSDTPDTGFFIDGTRLPDRSPVDVLLDGVTSEAAATDAAAPDAADMPWCTGKQIAFCADFDTVASWSDGWTTASVTPGAVLDFNLVDFTSPRRSLHSKIPAGGGTEKAAAHLSRVVSTTVSRSVLEFDCNVASIGAGTGEWLLQTARIGRNGRESGVALLAQDLGRWGVFIATDVPVLYGELPAPPPYGRFVHVTLDVTWSASAGSVTVLFDGVTVYSKDTVATALATLTSSIEVDIGLLEAAGTTPAAEMSVDNVTLQLR